MLTAGLLFPSLGALERPLFADCDQAPWRVVAELDARLRRWLDEREAGTGVNAAAGARIEGVVRCAALFAAAGAVVEPTAVLVDGPVVLGPGAVLRAGAYVRGPAFIGAEAVVGHATEVKNSVLLSRARAPHFNFVGDSVLGHDCNLGAGTRLANLRLDGRTIGLRWEGARIETGLRKLGALVGERAQTGCNSVCNPGTVLLPGAIVLPLQAVAGTVRSRDGRGVAPSRAAH